MFQLDPNMGLCIYSFIRVIAKSTLRRYWEKHAETEQPLKTWFHTVEKATWLTPGDIKKTYPRASIVGNNRVVFNIKGNDYRLVCLMKYKTGKIYIRFIGAHSEYDKINAAEI